MSNVNSARPVASIVVPIHNVEQYLEKCMDNMLGQTLRDIEVICVDDASTDTSVEILKRYAAKDDRVKLILHETCQTAAVARKEGVALSRGEFVLFVDPDDLLMTNACEALVKEMRRDPVDMLQFSVQVEGVGDVSAQRLEALERQLTPPAIKLKDINFADACFVDTQFSYTLWNKIFNGDMIRRAMQECPEGQFPKANDLLGFFFITLHLKSFRGVKTEPYYLYRLGTGVTGRTILTRKQIYASAMQAKVTRAIDAYLAEKGLSEQYAACASAIRDRLRQDSMLRLAANVAPEDLEYAWNTFVDCWGVGEVIGALAKMRNLREREHAIAYRDLPMFKTQPRKIRTIGAYYLRLANGGAQRVVAILCNLWVQMGYKVVLFTDTEPTEEDYPIPACVERIVLGDPEHEYDVLVKRATTFYEVCRSRQIDMMVYHAWLIPSLFWDMLAVKAAGTGFAVHCHSVFSMPVLSASITRAFYSSPEVFKMADGVFTLSKADTAYWKYTTPRVFTVKNPVFFDVSKMPVNSLDGRTVLWVGRMSDEKRPVQVLEIMRRVVDVVPDARLLMVGGGKETYMELMQRKVEQLELQNNVELCGFQMDVTPFYQKSDVYLCTSEYEGAPLTPLEAESFGMPVVSYNLGYVTLYESGLGCVQVPQMDKDAAAKALIGILSDDELRKQMGRDARRNVEENMLPDLPAQWQAIFDELEKPFDLSENEHDAAELVMMDTLREHIFRAKNRGVQTVDGFIPMPERGPLKSVRKKAVTFMKLLLIDGVSGLKQALDEKKKAGQ